LAEMRWDRSRHRRTIAVGARRLEVTVASVRGWLRWVRSGGAGGVGFAVATPVAVSDARAGRAPIPWFARGVVGAAAVLLTLRLSMEERGEREEDAGMAKLEKVGNLVGGAARPEEITKALTVVASGEGAVGRVTTAGDRSVIPLIETTFSGGYGGGGGGGTSGADATEEGVGGGGGGGGGGRTRTVAVVDVGPEGVTVRPVIDKTAITLALISGAFGLVTALVRRRR
jgi:uncharacterized spore protein YtfJ